MGYSNKSLCEQVDLLLDLFIVISQQQLGILINIHVFVVLALAFDSAISQILYVHDTLEVVIDHASTYQLIELHSRFVLISEHLHDEIISAHFGLDLVFEDRSLDCFKYISLTIHNETPYA